jgi:hypothetical protein
MIGDATTSRQQALLFYDRESPQEWKVTMKTFNTRARKFGSTVGKIVMALIFTSMIGSISIAPAFGRDIDKRDRYERDRYERDRYERDRYERNRYERGRRVYKPSSRYYRNRVQAPLPYRYTPDQYRSPGIELFFPFYIR